MEQVQRGTGALISIQLLTEQQVSQATNIPLPTLRNDRFRCKGFPYVRKGKSIRYRLSDLQRFLEANTIYPEGEAP